MAGNRDARWREADEGAGVHSTAVVSTAAWALLDDARTAYDWFGGPPRLASRQLPEIVDLRRVLYTPGHVDAGFRAVRRVPPRDLARVSAARFTRAQRRALARTLATSWPSESPYTPTAFGAAQVIERATAGWIVDRELVDEHLRALEDAAQRGAASMLTDISGMVVELRTGGHVPVTLGDRFWRASAEDCATAGEPGSPPAARGSSQVAVTRTAVVLGVIESNPGLWSGVITGHTAWTAAFSEAAAGLRRADTRFAHAGGSDGIVEHGGDWHPEHADRAAARRVHPDERRALVLADRNRNRIPRWVDITPRAVVMLAALMALFAFTTRNAHMMFFPSMLLGMAGMMRSTNHSKGWRKIRTEKPRRTLRRANTGPTRNREVTDAVVKFLGFDTPAPAGELLTLYVHYEDRVVEVTVPNALRVSHAVPAAWWGVLATEAASCVPPPEDFKEGMWELHLHSGADLPQYKSLSEIGVVSGAHVDLRRVVAADREGTADTGVNPPPAGMYEDWEPEAGYADVQISGSTEFMTGTGPDPNTVRDVIVVPSADLVARSEDVRAGLRVLNEKWLAYLIDPEEVFLTMPRLRDDEWPATKRYREAMGTLGEMIEGFDHALYENAVAAGEAALHVAEDAWNDARLAAADAGTVALPDREQRALRRAAHHISMLEDPALPKAMRDEHLRQLRTELDRLDTVPISFEQLMEMPALEPVRRLALEAGSRA